MKQYKYKGFFKSDTGDTYQLQVYCNGFIQAIILLTADAIREGKHYQLITIIDEKDSVREIGNLNQIIKLFK